VGLKGESSRGESSEGSEVKLGMKFSLKGSDEKLKILQCDCDRV
jgi:hypothetical protein